MHSRALMNDYFSQMQKKHFSQGTEDMFSNSIKYLIYNFNRIVIRD